MYPYIYKCNKCGRYFVPQAKRFPNDPKLCLELEDATFIFSGLRLRVKYSIYCIECKNPLQPTRDSVQRLAWAGQKLKSQAPTLRLTSRLINNGSATDVWLQALLKALYETPERPTEAFTGVKLHWTLFFAGVKVWLCFCYNNFEKEFSTSIHNPNVEVLLALFGHWRFSAKQTQGKATLSTQFKLLDTPARLNIHIDQKYGQKLRQALGQAATLLELLR